MPDQSTTVLLVVDELHMTDSLARRDPRTQGMIPVAQPPDSEDEQRFLAAMGLDDAMDTDLKPTRYNLVCEPTRPLLL
jgi:hypothetical protein